MTHIQRFNVGRMFFSSTFHFIHISPVRKAIIIKPKNQADLKGNKLKS